MEGGINALMINENLEDRKLNDIFKAKEKLDGKPDLKLVSFVFSTIYL